MSSLVKGRNSRVPVPSPTSPPPLNRSSEVKRPLSVSLPYTHTHTHTHTHTQSDRQRAIHCFFVFREDNWSALCRTYITQIPTPPPHLHLHLNCHLHHHFQVQGNPHCQAKPGKKVRKNQLKLEKKGRGARGWEDKGEGFESTPEERFFFSHLPGQKQCLPFALPNNVLIQRSRLSSVWSLSTIRERFSSSLPWRKSICFLYTELSASW